LELGDFAKIDDVTGDFETRFIWDVLEETKVSAVSPGPRELTMWNTFEQLRAKRTIPVISTNLTVKQGGSETPVGLPYLVIPVNGIKVAVFALMGGAELAAVRAPEGLEFGFKDPFEVAAALVPKLHKEADLVVLMSQMSTADTDRLLQAVPGIGVALYGQRAGWEQIARKKGETICQETGTRGQYSGELVVIIDPAGHVVDFGSENVTLDKEVPENPDILKQVNDANEKTKVMREDVRKAREAEQQKKTTTGERYLGDENCRRCHSEQYRSWQATPHARAFASLDRPLPGKPKAAACVSCHATGYGAGGFQPDLSRPDLRPEQTTAADLANVQCEACHKQGTLHLRTGNVEVAEAVCRGCHTPEWSPGFDFATALQAVKH
jgi:mono/diheme cytochrome c family protein